MKTLDIIDLHVSIDGTEILKGVNLTINEGEFHAIMGPNGTGKSTLSSVIMGDERYTITQGDILLDGQSILDLSVDERSRAGVFLAMQYPAEIPGVTTIDFLRRAVNAHRLEDEQLSVMAFLKKLDKIADMLEIDEEMTERYLNVGFSGGEKKRNEILQMMLLEPKLAILDEIDSGLDIDALKLVARGVNAMRNDTFSTLIITHYQRLLTYIHPDVVHIMMDGRIIETGDMQLVSQLEQTGYRYFADKHHIEFKGDA